MRPLARRVSALAVAVLALSACADRAGEPDPAVTAAPASSAAPVVSGPEQVDEELPEVAADELWLPRSAEGRRLVDPGWDGPPLHAEGIFLGRTEDGDTTTYTAVDLHGAALWRAGRPTDGARAWLTSTGDGRPLAVLAHSDASGRAVVHAYDLATGEPAWGPVESPAPLPGGRLVLAGAGADARPAALDPDTGAVLPAPSGARLVGQHDGILLTLQDGALLASEARSDAELWRTPVADLGLDPAALAPTDDPQETGLALLGTGGPGRLVVDLTDGTVLSTSARTARVDEATGVRVLHEDTTLRGVDPDGTELWSQSVTPDLVLLGVGGVFAYVREGDTVRALNVVGGETVEAYDPAGQGRIVVSTGFGPLGTASLVDGDRHLLATAPEDAPAP